MPGPPRPSFMIIDEHPVVRQGVRALIENTWSDATVTDVSNLAGALENAGSNGHGRIVVVDPWRSGADVGELVKRLTAELERRW